MTELEKCLADGITALIESAGRSCTINDVTDTEEAIDVAVVDRPEIPDPTKPARAQSPSYSLVYARQSDIENPRAVKQFVEVDTLVWHKVLTLQPSTNRAFYAFECESQR